MSLWRWLRDTELGFPKPLRINDRRYWHESELVAWERSAACRIQRRQQPPARRREAR